MEEEKINLQKLITSDFKQETPSFDFTDSVMSKIELSIAERKIIEPLISKKAWSIVFLVSFLVILSSFSFEIQKLEIHLFDNFDFPKITDFIVTIKLFFAISFVLISLTILDLFYRKSKQLV